MFIYSARVWKSEYEGESNVWYADFPAFEGNCFTDGEGFKGAIEEAAETLRLVIASYISRGMKLPEEEQQLGDVWIAVDVDDDFVLRTSCVTVKEAAEELGVTHSRVCALLRDGKLEAVKYGNGRLVTLHSINDYKSCSRSAGRPRKAEK